MSLRQHCDACGLQFLEGSGDTWALIYLSTAGITGLIVILILLAGTELVTDHRWALASFAFLTIVLTLPYRKGLAVAIEHIINRSLDGGGSPATSRDVEAKAARPKDEA